MLGFNVSVRLGSLLTDRYLTLIGFKKIGMDKMDTIYNYKNLYTLRTRINDLPLLVQIFDDKTGKRIIDQYIYTIQDWKRVTKSLKLK
jgi:hypothetical protein